MFHRPHHRVTASVQNGLPVHSTGRNEHGQRSGRSRGERRQQQLLEDEHNHHVLSSEELLILGQNHLLAFLAIMCFVLLTCRLGWGWIPGRDPPDHTSTELQPLSSPPCVTIVIAILSIPCQRQPFPKQDKLDSLWIQRVASLQDNVVFLSTPNLIPILNELRHMHARPNTRFRTVTMEDLGISQTTLDPNQNYHHHHHHDYESHNHPKCPRELQEIVQNKKLGWMQNVMEWNPFNSTFFAWVNARYFTNSLLENQQMIRFLPTPLTQTQVLLLDVCSHTVPTRPIQQPQPQRQNCTSSGDFIGGYQPGLAQFIQEYNTLVESQRQQQQQHPLAQRLHNPDWIWETCQQKPQQQLCFWIQPRNTNGDLRYSMGPLLHGVSQYTPWDHLLHALRSSHLGLFVKRWSWRMWMWRNHMDLSIWEEEESNTWLL